MITDTIIELFSLIEKLLPASASNPFVLLSTNIQTIIVSILGIKPVVLSVFSTIAFFIPLTLFMPLFIIWGLSLLIRILSAVYHFITSLT